MKIRLEEFSTCLEARLDELSLAGESLIQAADAGWLSATAYHELRHARQIREKILA